MVVEKGGEQSATPTVTLSAQATNEEGKKLISHGPLTIDLTDLEHKLATMHQQSNANTHPVSTAVSKKKETFQDVIDQDGSKFSSLLINIKRAYEDFV